VGVALQGAELVHCGEHVYELVQALGKQLKPQEDRPLIHLNGLQDKHKTCITLSVCSLHV
jgi:hypothetical protein